jgi:uncharacterized protein (DUF2235 family)
MERASDTPKQAVRASEQHAPRPRDGERQRLVLCLDGTWNKRASGTNIYHLANLVREGDVGEREGIRYRQVVYYDEGVGTGLLDSITGGGFGLGLSDNVRQAYDWLVEKYCDEDEIFIFGFSRGAFTARSLVGLISRCGLLYRGSPLPQEELWNAYRIMGRHGDPRMRTEPSENWWERIVGKPKMPFNHIWALKPDPWEVKPREIATPANRTEELVVQWSRRVRIRCLGIFDTVGSMGLDALAIPWLRNKTARFHDTKLSSLVIDGFQALAIDEHRANFPHIVWRRPAFPWDGQPKHEGAIEQRWFVGAHSNIGGGYDDNLLARFPLAWMVERCGKIGLVFREAKSPDLEPKKLPDCTSLVPLRRPTPKSARAPKKPPPLRDSYAEIAKGLWKHLVRSKPHYRHIDPPVEYQDGVAMKSVKEQIDESVWEFLRCEPSPPPPGVLPYDPPNLWQYRMAHPLPPLPTDAEAAVVNERVERVRTEAEKPNPPKQRYFVTWRDSLWLLWWLILVAAAAATFAYHGGYPWFSRGWLTAVGLTTAVAFASDWVGSHLNFEAALDPLGFRGEALKAFATGCMAVRLVVLIAILISIPCWIALAAPWLTKGNFSPALQWLLWLEVVLLYCAATARWCAQLMAEAGFRPLGDLRKQVTPKGVQAYLQNPAQEEEAPTVAQQSLMPIVHTIWRDNLAFIPTFAIATWVGYCVLQWLLATYGAGLNEWFRTKVEYSAIAMPWALGIWIATDLLENTIHLRHIEKYPDAPGKTQVLIGFVATVFKTGAFAVAFAPFVIAVVWCAAMVWTEVFRADTTSGLRLVAAIVPLLFLLPRILRTFRGKHPRHPN